MDQHFVSRFYLDAFLAPKAQKIWEFSIEDGKWRNKPTKKSAVVPDLYTLDDVASDDKLAYEEMFQKIESGTARTIKKVIQGKELSDQERADLAGFVGFCQTRTPGDLELQTNFYQQLLDVQFEMYRGNREALDQLKSDFKVRTGKDLDDEFLENLKLKPKKHLVLHGMAQKMKVAGELLAQMRLTVLRTDSPVFSFITSDYPVSIYDPTIPKGSFFGAGLGFPNVEVFLPLGRKVGVLLTNKPDLPEEGLATDLQLEQLNSRTIAFAQKFVYADSVNVLPREQLNARHKSYSKPSDHEQ